MLSLRRRLRDWRYCNAHCRCSWSLGAREWHRWSLGWIVQGRVPLNHPGEFLAQGGPEHFGWVRLRARCGHTPQRDGSL